LDLAFLPKDLLYNENNYNDSNKHLLQAIEILENAQNQKDKNSEKAEDKEGFWGKVSSFFNPFKCGQNN
jgi:hypothetical protein